MHKKLMIGKTEKHLKNEDYERKQADRQTKLKAVEDKKKTGKINIDNVYEQNQLILEMQTEILDLLKSRR